MTAARTVEPSRGLRVGLPRRGPRPPSARQGVPASRLRRVGYYLVIPGAVLGLWSAAFYLQWMPIFLLPSPVLVLFETLPRALTEGVPAIQHNLVVHAAESLRRVGLGLLLATLTGVPLGIVLGYWPKANDWSATVINAGRSLPPSALVPVAILWFGIGDQPAYFLIWFASFWPILLNTIAAVNDVERILRESARTMGARTLDLIRTVIVPGALPRISVGIRVGFGLGWSAVVTAELLAVRSGLGYFVWQGRQLFRMDFVIAGIIVVGFLGVVIDAIIQRIQRRAFRWQRGVTI
jgi:NitT/TauT family transport system permease protein